MGEPLGGSVVVYKLGATFMLVLTGVLTYLGLSEVFGCRRMPAVFIDPLQWFVEDRRALIAGLANKHR